MDRLFFIALSSKMSYSILHAFINIGNIHFFRAISIFVGQNQYPQFFGARYPFTEPMVIPFTKYFWKNGYAHIKGRIPITATARRMVTVGTASEEVVSWLK